MFTRKPVVEQGVLSLGVRLFMGDCYVIGDPREPPTVVRKPDVFTPFTSGILNIHPARAETVADLLQAVRFITGETLDVHDLKDVDRVREAIEQATSELPVLRTECVQRLRVLVRI